MHRLAADLDARMGAEGIETDDELAALRDVGVPYVQGHLLGRPVPDIGHHVQQLGIADAPAVGASAAGTG
jgi:EAL domain-containing protein (putative c-di-GMP-specific phosphodiesterase class I)